MPVSKPGWEEFRIRDSSDTLSLRYAIYRPSAQPISRCLIFAQGRAEYIEKYDYLVNDLDLPEDCAVLTWDHRGQGASGGARAYVDSYDHYVEDLELIISKAIDGIPYVMVCHSMGGLVCLLGTLEKKFAPEALVLASPLLMLPDAPVPRRLHRPVAMLLNKMGLGTLSSGVGTFENASFANNSLTHSFKRFEQFKAAQYKCPAATIGWIHATHRAIERVFDPKKLQSFQTRTLILSAGEESVVDTQGVVHWIKAVHKHSHAEVVLQNIAGARHELFSETKRFYDRALKAVSRFLTEFFQRKKQRSHKALSKQANKADPSLN